MHALTHLKCASCFLYQLPLFEEVGDRDVKNCVILPDDIKVDNEVAIRDRAYLGVEVAP